MAATLGAASAFDAPGGVEPRGIYSKRGEGEFGAFG